MRTFSHTLHAQVFNCAQLRLTLVGPQVSRLLFSVGNLH